MVSCYDLYLLLLWLFWYLFVIVVVVMIFICYCCGCYIFICYCCGCADISLLLWCVLFVIWCCYSFVVIFLCCCFNCSFLILIHCCCYECTLLKLYILPPYLKYNNAVLWLSGVPFCLWLRLHLSLGSQRGPGVDPDRLRRSVFPLHPDVAHQPEKNRRNATRVVSAAKEGITI